MIAKPGRPRALITGITGQDGSYLAELLVRKGYEVWGIIRRASSVNTCRIDHLHDAGSVRLLYGDLSDSDSIRSALAASDPDEVYNLAAQSHVRVSFDQPIYTLDIGALGAVRLFQGILEHRDGIRVYQASSSEMFGNAPAPQSEATPFAPRSPYAIAKVAAYYAARHYRDRGLWISNGILFNHTSRRRGVTFVERKITLAAAYIKAGLRNGICLGNLDARRDWGHARDYVRAMHLMLQQDQPDDYVIATGESHSVCEVLEMAFGALDLDWNDYLTIDPRLLRPAEVDDLRGDSSKARDNLRWQPDATFGDIINEMLRGDLTRANLEAGMVKA